MLFRPGLWDMIDLDSPVADHPLNESLVAWWPAPPPLDGGSILYDVAGRNHGTLTGFAGTSDLNQASPANGTTYTPVPSTGDVTAGWTITALSVPNDGSGDTIAFVLGDSTSTYQAYVYLSWYNSAVSYTWNFPDAFASGTGFLSPLSPTFTIGLRRVGTVGQVVAWNGTWDGVSAPDSILGYTPINPHTAAYTGAVWAVENGLGGGPPSGSASATVSRVRVVKSSSSGSPWTAGPAGLGGLLSSGGPQYVDLGASAPWASQASGHIAFRFRTDSVFSSDGVKSVLGYGGSNSSGGALVAFLLRRTVLVSSGTRLDLTTVDGSGMTRGVSGSTDLSAGTWYTGIVASTGSAWKMWINGVAESLSVWIGTNTGLWWSGATGQTSPRYSIGAVKYGDDGNCLDGVISDVRISPLVPDDAYAKALHDQMASGHPDTLARYTPRAYLFALPPPPVASAAYGMQVAGPAGGW